jgi:hypothetical protein
VDPSGEAAQLALVISWVTYTVSIGQTVMIAWSVFIVQQNPQGAVQLLKTANETAVDLVVSTNAAVWNWYTNTYSPWAAQLGDYVYDTVHGDEDQSNSDDDSQAASSGGSPSPGNGGGKKDGKKENSTTSTPQAEKKSWDLIPWRLKSSKSYHTAYAEKTVNQLNQLVKQWDQKAKQMLKLVKETARLMEKQWAKSKK